MTMNSRNRWLAFHRGSVPDGWLCRRSGWLRRVWGVVPFLVPNIYARPRETVTPVHAI
jgi:hypothetical protein